MPGLESPDSVGNGIRSSFDGISGELKKYEGLKKKYEEVVAYTVQLTAERDTLMENCERSKRELAKEVARRRQSGAAKEPLERAGSGSSRAMEEVSEKGFSFFILLLSAFLAFLSGRFWREIWLLIMGRTLERNFEEEGIL